MTRRSLAALLTGLLALVPTPARANGFVAAATLGDNGGTTSSLTTSFTAAGGSTNLLLVFFEGDLITGADNITSVTYNAVGMTAGPKFTGCTGDRFMYSYYLINPTAGAHNVAITAGSSHWLLAGAAEYNGVNTTTPIETSSTNIGAANALTLTTSTTTAVANDMLVAFPHGPAGTNTMTSTGGYIRSRSTANDSWLIMDSGGSVPTGSNSTGASMGSIVAGKSMCTLQLAVEFTATVTGPEDASKLNNYAVLQSTSIDTSKLNNYAVLQSNSEAQSKTTGFAVLSSAIEAQSKTTGFAVLAPPSGGANKLMFKSGPGW